MTLRLALPNIKEKQTYVLFYFSCAHEFLFLQFQNAFCILPRYRYYRCAQLMNPDLPGGYHDVGNTHSNYVQPPEPYVVIN
jgi:hypothetical protein